MKNAWLIADIRERYPRNEDIKVLLGIVEEQAKENEQLRERLTITPEKVATVCGVASGCLEWPVGVPASNEIIVEAEEHMRAALLAAGMEEVKP